MKLSIVEVLVNLRFVMKRIKTTLERLIKTGITFFRRNRSIAHAETYIAGHCDYHSFLISGLDHGRLVDLAYAYTVPNTELPQTTICETTLCGATLSRETMAATRQMSATTLVVIDPQ